MKKCLLTKISRDSVSEKKNLGSKHRLVQNKLSAQKLVDYLHYKRIFHSIVFLAFFPEQKL